MTTANGRVTKDGSPRVLLFSEKNIYEHAVWRCSFHEFERIIQEIDSVDVISPKPKSWYTHGKRAALRSGKYFSTPLSTGVEKVKLEREYDLFFTVCEKPSELLNLRSVDWKGHCKTSVCWLPEFYAYEIDEHKSCMEVLSQFDYVIYMFVVIDPFQKILGGKGTYLPAGVDCLLFCPYPDPPARSIDVLSIGRRSEITHQELLRMMREDGMFYVYDTIDSLRAYNLDEHRLLAANRAKRSRYFLVNPGKVNKPEETGGQSEFGYRYFEAAAPGTIMIGQRPTNNREFDRIFHWEDAVIDMPFDSDNIRSIIRELDKEPERQHKIRRTNMVQSLLYHDWAYRWESVLKIAGMEALPALSHRKQRLKDLAAQVEESCEPVSVAWR